MRSKIVILGAGFAGHTAALHLSHLIKGLADITVVAPSDRFTWFPSLIWVGTGTMSQEKVHFQLRPVYDKLGITYLDARAETVAPEERTVAGRDAARTPPQRKDQYQHHPPGPYQH